jgi:hypothetical protein
MGVMIPDEAVKAAGEHLPPVWTSNPVYRAELVAALAAAAPYLMAAAWDEGYREADYDAPHSIKTDNPYRRNLG